MATSEKRNSGRVPSWCRESDRTRARHMCQAGRLACCICAMLTAITIYHTPYAMGLAAGSALTTILLTFMAIRWEAITGENDEPIYHLLRQSGINLWLPFLAYTFIRDADTSPLSEVFIVLFCVIPAAGLIDLYHTLDDTVLHGCVRQACRSALWIFIPATALIFISTRFISLKFAYLLPLLILIYIQLTFSALFHVVRIRFLRSPEDLNRFVTTITNTKPDDLRNI